MASFEFMIPHYKVVDCVCVCVVKPFKNAMLHNFFKLIDIEKVTLVKVLNFAHNTMRAKLSRL